MNIGDKMLVPRSGSFQTTIEEIKESTVVVRIGNATIEIPSSSISENVDDYAMFEGPYRKYLTEPKWRSNAVGDEQVMTYE